MLAAVIDWSSPTMTRRRRPVTVARYGPRRLASEERHFVSPIPASGEPGVASDRVNPSSVRRRHRWIPGHYSLGGLAFALAFLWFSMTPTLLPRGPVFQALISALSAAFGYAIGVLASRTFRYVVRREPPPAVKRVAWRGLPVVAVLGTAAMFVWFFVWEHRLRMLMDAAQLSVFDSVVIVVLTVVLFGLIIGVSRMWVRAQRWLEPVTDQQYRTAQH